MRLANWVAALLGVACVAAAGARAAAQTAGQPAAQTGTPVAASSEIEALYGDLSDIDKLRVLNPLKLTPEQLDKMITVLQDQQKDYNKKLDEALTAPVRAMAKDIKETRQKLLSGGAIPKDFDDRAKKTQDDITAKRKKLDADALRSVADSFRDILTPTQLKKAVEMVKAQMVDDNGEPTMKGTDAQFFNFYVMATFMAYPRIVPLLQDVRKAVPATTTTGRAPSRSAPARVAALPAKK